jgi:hypothetical protein
MSSCQAGGTRAGSMYPSSGNVIEYLRQATHVVGNPLRRIPIAGCPQQFSRYIH